MAHPFPSQEWIEAWEDAVNDSAYTEKGKGWGVEFNGDMLFHLESDDRLPEDRYFLVGLEDGEAHDCREVDDPDAVEYGFALRAPYAQWVRLTSGDVGIIAALMTGKFDLEGDMQKVLRYTEAATLLTGIAAEVDSEYVY